MNANNRARLMQVISNHPMASRNLAIRFLKKGEPLPEQIIRGVSKDSTVSKEVAIWMADLGYDQIPEKLLRSIMRSPDMTYKFASTMLNDYQKPLPELILNQIAQEHPVFHKERITQYMLTAGIEPPEWYLRAIFDTSKNYQNDVLAYNLAIHYLVHQWPGKKKNTIPPVILDYILQSHNAVFMLHRYLKKTNQPMIPEVEQSLEKFEKEKSPEENEESRDSLKRKLLRIVMQNENDSRDLAIRLIKQNRPVPGMLMQTIRHDPAGSYWVAIQMLDKKKEVPEMLNQSILRMTQATVWYALSLLKRGMMPVQGTEQALIRNYREEGSSEHLEKLIGAYAQYRYALNRGAVKAGKQNELPETSLLMALNKDPDALYRVAKMYMALLLPVPEPILSGLQQFGKKKTKEQTSMFSARLVPADMDHILHQLQLHNQSRKSAEPKTKNENVILETNEAPDNNHGLENKKKLLNVIGQDSMRSTFFMAKLLHNKKQIPEYLINKLKENKKGFIVYQNLFNRAMADGENSKRIFDNHKELEQLVGAPTEASVIIDSLILNYGSYIVPKFLIELILQDSYTSERYANHLLQERYRGALAMHMQFIPDRIIDKIAESMATSYAFYKEAKKYKQYGYKIPEKIVRAARVFIRHNPEVEHKKQEKYTPKAYGPLDR